MNETCYILTGADPRPTSTAFPHAKALGEAKGGTLPDRYDEPSRRGRAAGGLARDDTKEIVVPTQKDLKRLIRSRMQKSGEAYTAARLQILKKNTEPDADFAERAGMSDAAVRKRTGRGWAEWVRVLDAEGASDKPHRDIAQYVSSLGAPDWWAQTVTVGYERIRGLRDRGQRRGGGYEASKSRTFNVPVETLFKAFADARVRRRWLPVAITVRSATPPKRMRVIWDDETVVQVGFTAKGDKKSAVAIQHEKLPNRSSVDAMKKVWGEHFDRLAELHS